MRKLAWFASAFGAAALLCCYTVPMNWLVGLGLGCALGAALVWFSRRERGRRFVLLLAGLAAGFLWFRGWTDLRLGPVEVLAGTTAPIRATVTDWPTPTDYGQRVEVTVSGVPTLLYTQGEAGELRPGDEVAVTAALKRADIRREEQTSFEYINAAGMTVPDISAMALSRRHQVVYVDYLQKLQARGQNRFELVTSVSSDLQRMAKAHGIAVVALSQLSRAQKTKSGAWIPPSMSDFRESGQIEQDADVAMLLWPEDMNDYRSNRILKIGKNKEGTKADLTLEFDGLHQTMREVPKDESRAIAAQMSSVGRNAKRSAQAKANMEQMQFAPLSVEDPDMPF